MSKRRITQQVSEGGWGIRKVDRNRYVLSEDETSYSGHKKSNEISDQERLEYENAYRERLDLTEDPKDRIYLISIIAEMELDRLSPEGKGPEFKDEDRPSNGKKIEI